MNLRKFRLANLLIQLSLSFMILAHCASTSKVEINTTATATGMTKDAKPESFQFVKFLPDRVNSKNVAKASVTLKHRVKLASLAAGFSLERPQPLDEGIYGKVGVHTVFIASSQKIPDYDRLYWVMVRVLSDKYGCFIRKKISTPRTVSFECKDRRTVVMDRDISTSFAMFTGRQYDRYGKMIDMQHILPTVKTASK
jgi:hypothetical protein